MTRLFLAACALTVGLAFGLAGCDGVGTSPSEISEDDSTAAANALRPSLKDTSVVPDSVTQVGVGDTLTIPVEAVAEMPEDTSRGGSLKFKPDSVSVTNSDLPVGEEAIENRGTTLVFFAPTTAGELDIRFLPVYGDFVTAKKGTLPVTVQAGNQPPEATDDSATTTEGTAVTTDVLANDTDPEGNLDPSTVTVQDMPDSGSATANEDGTITYDPDEGFTGEDSYTYTVADSAGAESGEATVTIEVEEEVEDTTPPTVDSGTVASDNGHVDVSFSEGVFGNAEGSGPVETSDFDLAFNQGDGSATGASITGVTDTTGNTLEGGEEAVRVQIDVEGGPASGEETVEITPSGGSAIFDAAGNAASADETTGALALSDQKAPDFDPQGSSPSDDATGVSVGVSPELAFSEAVEAGSGEIRLVETGEGVVESFNVETGDGDGGGTVTFSESSVTLDPGSNLATGTDYHVEIADGAVEDQSGNAFGGFSDETKYNFTTE